MDYSARSKIVKELLRQKDASQVCVSEILGQQNLTYEFFDGLFTEYLCHKFMLKRSDLTTDNFYEICQISADKASNLPKGMLDAAELASKCGGATTAMNKKVLFFLAVNREFKIQISPEESVDTDTFTQVKKLVFHYLNG